MGKTGLYYSLLYYFILNSPFVRCANAAFTEVPKDVSVGEGEDVEMPCAFKAVSSAPMSLEIQWWYLKEDDPKDLPHELQIGAPTNRAKDGFREATKISTVRVQGNAISHRLSLSKVKKEDEGVYECRVTDLWAEETQDFTVHATLRVTAGGGMVAEEAVSHIQNRWPLRNTNSALGGGLAGSATLKPSQGLTGRARSGQGKLRVSQQAQPDLLPSMSSTTSVAKSSASPLPVTAAILRQHGADCSMMSTMDPLLFITLLFLHKFLPLLLAH
ncbi:V-set and transmembrane domain-containing protein 2B [Austrofundulus limnaeus]|uniref:V-set and transmembrane domain-containing protein 2B n=1 Tax=Austrofundulus limnaeus TaxID=52670 RepID=A0A2I4C9I2_AUSLI|nr:PREDICTED: V-set and transmembrane domain-containing protein 2B [Austrofundulus limnaeus]